MPLSGKEKAARRRLVLGHPSCVRRTSRQPDFCDAAMSLIGSSAAKASCSDWRNRSICILKFAGNSRSSFNDDLSLSPISRTIARLCRVSMSTGFRTTALPTPRSVLATLQIEWRPPPLAIVRERLFLTAGPKTFGYPRHAPFGNGGRRSRNNNSPVRTFVPVPLTTFSFL
jgi:hypothetical protein